MTMRADLALVKKGLVESREKAQALIMAGQVYLGEVQVLKPSQAVKDPEALLLRGEVDQWASRGAYKLEKAMEDFRVNPANLVAMDIGAASGGFTDVLLKRGARRVYAIDVGYGQLDYRLRQDERVVVMERTNARHLTRDHFPEVPSLTVMDVSFISIKLILPTAWQIMGEEGRVITLIKPQFEAGRGQVGKHGVVREPKVHEAVLRDIRDFAAEMGWQAQAFTYSPVKGPKGNIEFLADLKKTGLPAVSDQALAALVETAHRELDKPPASLLK